MFAKFFFELKFSVIKYRLKELSGSKYNRVGRIGNKKLYNFSEKIQDSKIGAAAGTKFRP